MAARIISVNALMELRFLKRNLLFSEGAPKNWE
jgi:hypothetical protein